MPSAEPFRVLTSGLDALSGGRPRVLDALYAGTIHGVVLEGVLTPDEAARAVAGLEASPEIRSPLSDDSPIELVGRPLQWSAPDRAAYLDAADAVRTACRERLGGVPLLERILELLERAAGVPARVVTETGRAYAPMTLRRLPESGFVGPHHELGQLEFPAYAWLRDQLDATTVVSFYVVLQAPDRGGELALYPVRWGSPEAETLRDTRGGEAAILARHAPTSIAARPGDVLLFDSGRWAHSVRTVLGPRPRWTAGGLAAFTPDHRELWVWA